VAKDGAAERGRLLHGALGKGRPEHADELTALEQRDCGKPTKQAGPMRWRWRATSSFTPAPATSCTARPFPTNGYSVLTWREPHGVTGHIIPWNYPMQIFGRSVGGALAAGNVCVVKPAEDACLSLIRVAQLAAEVGFPPGAINIVTGYGHEVGDALARHPGIDHISFTGSPKVGTLIQQVAAERHCPVTLELGGKSPQIIFADADLDAAVPVVINAIVQNAGQTCSAGSRVLIDSLIYEPLLERLGEAFEALRVGPAAMDLDVGPLIRQTQQQRVWDFLSDAQVAGIPMVAQGQMVDEAPETGFTRPPRCCAMCRWITAWRRKKCLARCCRPWPSQDEDHAVELANATQFGLVAGVWTRDGAPPVPHGRRVHSGQVFINNYGAGGGVELPFGGVKSSGYGREKGFEALYGFTTLKTVAIQHG
jgi:aldehyde dehydrogenase (NAD+)